MTGEVVLAGHVLLATGAYINFSGMLREVSDLQLDLNLTSQTVAFLRISPSEASVSSALPVSFSYQLL